MSSVEKLITENMEVWTLARQKKNGRGRGNGKKVALVGIKKLRELILELAVRGKLVPQDPMDEPAGVLLERIADEKARLVKKKKIKRQKKLPVIKGDEKLFDLPEGWQWVRLNDLGEWGAGATPKRGNPEFYGGNISWFKSGELTTDYISESEETVTQAALDKSSLRYNKVGDVLVAMYGATIGKTAILRAPATTNQAVCACTPFKGFLNTYLLTLLKAYKPRLIAMGAGGAQPNISREKIISTVAGLPPFAEQHRIVAKVNELMALCDQLEQQTEASLTAHATLVANLLKVLVKSPDAEELKANWNRMAGHFTTLFTTEESINQLKATILQLAVMGKLVPQDPNDEPASELVKRIADEKARLVKEKKIKKQKALPEITEEEKPFDVPEVWEWCRFVQVAYSRLGKMLDKAKNKGDLKKYLRNTNVQWQCIDLSDLKEMRFEEYELEAFRLCYGDLLICEGGEPGRCAIWYHNDLEVYFQKALHRSRSYVGVLSNYIEICFMAGTINGTLSNLFTGATIKHLPGDKLARYVVPIPPTNEQHLIVAKVNQLMTLCDTLKTQITEAATTRVQLAEALVAQAVA